MNQFTETEKATARALLATGGTNAAAEVLGVSAPRVSNVKRQLLAKDPGLAVAITYAKELHRTN